MARVLPFIQFTMAITGFSCSSELQLQVWTCNESARDYPLIITDNPLIITDNPLIITCNSIQVQKSQVHVTSTSRHQFWAAAAQAPVNRSRGTLYRSYGDSCPPKSNYLSAAVQQTLTKRFSVYRCPIGTIQTSNSSA